MALVSLMQVISGSQETNFPGACQCKIWLFFLEIGKVSWKPIEMHLGHSSNCGRSIVFIGGQPWPSIICPNGPGVSEFRAQWCRVLLYSARNRSSYWKLGHFKAYFNLTNMKKSQGDIWTVRLLRITSLFSSFAPWSQPRDVESFRRTQRRFGGSSRPTGYRKSHILLWHGPGKLVSCDPGMTRINETSTIWF